MCETFFLETNTQAPGSAEDGDAVGLVEALFDARVHLGHKVS